MTIPEADRRQLEGALADDRFLRAASAESDGPISVRGFSEPPTAEQLRQYAIATEVADQRFFDAALAEHGMPVSAGWRVSGPKIVTDEPENADLDCLPRWARVAFNARCARRSLPLYQQYWPEAPDNGLRDLMEAVRVAEEFASNPDARFDASSILQAAERVNDLVFRETRTGRADHPAFFSSVAAMVAIACAESARRKEYCELNAALHAANAVENLLPLLIQDFNTISAAAWLGGWTDETPVPRHIFGPL
jgi:hypothetical protein